MARSLMIQGTGSGAGKSLIVTALCRIFRDEGISVAPFKAQNMALNSYITIDGGEIGRAQALQAEAARIEPTIDMNPVLLKASGDMGSQVIIHGKVHSTMKAKEYYAFKKTAWAAVKESFERLSNRHEIIIMEGAGSPAEINLMDVDIVNMSMARHAGAPVILVGDIDRGGVFASLYGTIELLKDGSNSLSSSNCLNSLNSFKCDADYIKAFIINKFRGDMDILKPGLDMIKEKTGRPVIGVLPYIRNIGLPEEDGLSLKHFKRFEQFKQFERIKVVIVRLQYISNFTDFDPLLYEPDVELLYSNNPAEIENADIVIIPGTKNTVKDLQSLRESHLDESIRRAYAKGVQIIGICGGYQMLGKRIYDPHCVEGICREVDGIGLLDIETVFEMTKVTCQTEAELVKGAFDYRSSGEKLKGYEIHMGRSNGDIGLFRLSRITHHASHITDVFDGSINNNCWGTYLHGIFDNDLFRRAIINTARRKKNLAPLDFTVSYSEIKDSAINNLASVVRENMDMDFIKRLLKI